VTGLPILEPFVRLAAGEDPKEQFQNIFKFIVIPIIATLFFIGLWSLAASNIKTDSAELPSPSSTWAAAKELWASHRAQKIADATAITEERAKAKGFMQQAKAAEKQAASATGNDQKRALANAEVYKKKSTASSQFPTFVGTHLCRSNMAKHWHRVRRFLHCHDHRGAAGNPVRYEPDLQCGDESDHSAFQAGQPAGLAADCVDRHHLVVQR